MTRKQRQLSPKQQMDLRALSMLVDETKSFEIEDKDGNNVTYKLYPLQLGRLALITERLIHLDLILDDPETDVVKAMWEICADQPRKVAEIIAIATLRTKDDIDNRLEERVNELLWSPTMTPQALTNILYTIIFQSYHEDFMKAIRAVIVAYMQCITFCAFIPLYFGCQHIRMRNFYYSISFSLVFFIIFVCKF